MTREMNRVKDEFKVSDFALDSQTLPVYLSLPMSGVHSQL